MTKKVLLIIVMSVSLFSIEIFFRHKQIKIYSSCNNPYTLPTHLTPAPLLKKPTDPQLCLLFFYLGLSGPSSLFLGTTISLDAFKSKISQSCNCSTIKLPQRQFPWGPLTPLKYILSSSIYLYSVGMQYLQKQLFLMLSKSRISMIFFVAS